MRRRTRAGMTASERSGSNAAMCDVLRVCSGWVVCMDMDVCKGGGGPMCCSLPDNRSSFPVTELVESLGPIDVRARAGTTAFQAGTIRSPRRTSARQHSSVQWPVLIQKSYYSKIVEYDSPTLSTSSYLQQLDLGSNHTVCSRTTTGTQHSCHPTTSSARRQHRHGTTAHSSTPGPPTFDLQPSPQ